MPQNTQPTVSQKEFRATAERLRVEFAELDGIEGVGMELAMPGYDSIRIFGSLGVEPQIFEVDRKTNILLKVSCSPGTGAVADCIGVAVRSVIERLEGERREELLLEELGSNWESLDAIYEISADVLRYADVETALERLINRFTSLQEGMRTALFLTRSGRLKPIAGDATDTLDWVDLGGLEKPVGEGRAIVVSHITAETAPTGLAPWAVAQQVAAAPVTARLKVIGFLAAWRNDHNFEFDAPFSRLLEAITHQASMLLESDRLKRTMRENERWAQEIEIASSIQQSLLFGDPPTGLARFDMASFSAASQRIDGDFHDFLRHSNECVDVLVGDVMGKGIAAALLGAATKNQFLRAIASLAIRANEGAPSPEAIVNRAALGVVDQLIQLERFVTLCYARFDVGRSLLEFVDCGHTGILLYRKQTGETTFLRGEDLPIGIMPKFSCQQQSHRMMPGDTYLLFSDGVTETRNPTGDLFGEERLVECVVNWSSLGADILVDQIRKHAAAFGEHRPQADDFTCIAVTIRVDEGPPPVAVWHEEFRCDLEELERMRRWMAAAATGLPGGGLGDVGCGQLELACTELFVNCIAHGETGLCGGPIRMTATVYQNHMNVELRHDGIAFDPLSVPPPSFDGSRDGGFGTYIVFHCADELAYSRVGDTNVISISIIRKQ